ncbi:MAG: methyltransferase domain-containing protein, partial [Pricia sp.]|nr:methyltransferase domain-containing protein [Pricia sp.]
LDMGCGDGTMLKKVAIWARKEGFKVDCIGIDFNEKGLDLARKASADFPEIQYMKQDILTLRPEKLKCDILICTLTMHHFYDEEIPIFLEQFAKLAHIGIVINDLQRSPVAYHLFRVFSAIFVRTKIAKHDGLVSVRRGFTKPELIAFSKSLPSMEHDIRWKWAFRYVWVMRTKRLTEIYE